MPIGDEGGPILRPPAEARRCAILTAAAELLRERGANGFTMNDVLDATGFDADDFRDAVTDDRSVVELLVLERVDQELSTQESLLRDLDSLPGLQRWRDETVRRQGADISAGRPLGALVSRTAAQHEPARLVLKSGFETWQRYLAAGIRRMIVRGELTSEADPNDLAVSILAAVQGGVLLARTSGQIHQLEVALDIAISQVRAYMSAVPRSTNPPGELVDHEGADVVQGHVQGSFHRSNVMGGLG